MLDLRIGKVAPNGTSGPPKDLPVDRSQMGVTNTTAMKGYPSDMFSEEMGALRAVDSRGGF